MKNELKPSEMAGKKQGKQNGYKNAVLHAKRNRKRREAEARQFEYDGLTLQQKLARAKGKREQTRLLAKLAAAAKKAVAVVEVKKPETNPVIPSPKKKAYRKAAKVVNS